MGDSSCPGQPSTARDHVEPWASCVQCHHGPGDLTPWCRTSLALADFLSVLLPKSWAVESRRRPDVAPCPLRVPLP